MKYRHRLPSRHAQGPDRGDPRVATLAGCSPDTGSPPGRRRPGLARRVVLTAGGGHRRSSPAPLVDVAAHATDLAVPHRSPLAVRPRPGAAPRPGAGRPHRAPARDRSGLPARRRAYVERRLARAGYDVSRQRFAVPAGDSWGVPVAAGTSLNVVATPPGFDPGAPYLLVGAHLDTVAVAPGAEDNASGVAVLLETGPPGGVRGHPAAGGASSRSAARSRAGRATTCTTSGRAHYVARMSAAERRGLRGMVSLDRVGVGGRCRSAPAPLHADRGCATPCSRSARRLGIPTVSCGREHGQRPLVVRAGGAPGRAARQHAVRRLPLRRRRARGRRPAPSSAGSAGSSGAGSEPAEPPEVRRTVGSRRAVRHHARREVGADPVGHEVARP